MNNVPTISLHVQYDFRLNNSRNIFYYLKNIYIVYGVVKIQYMWNKLNEMERC